MTKAQDSENTSLIRELRIIARELDHACKTDDGDLVRVAIHRLTAQSPHAGCFCPYCNPSEDVPKPDNGEALRKALGLVLVDIEPTDIMISAADATMSFARGTETHRMVGGITPEGIWRTMIAAARCHHDWQYNLPTQEVCLKCQASRHIEPKE